MENQNNRILDPCVAQVFSKLALLTNCIVVIACLPLSICQI